MYVSVVDARSANILGAWLLLAADSLGATTEQAAGHRGALAATLVVLRQEPGIGIDRLGATLRVSQPAAVRLVNQLVEAGLARRGAGGPDGRRTSVRLTAAGTRAAGAVLKSRQRAIEDLLSGLSPAERDQLARLAEKACVAGIDGWLHAQQVCRLCDIVSCPPASCPVDAAGGPAPSTP